MSRTTVFIAEIHEWLMKKTWFNIILTNKESNGSVFLPVILAILCPVELNCCYGKFSPKLKLKFKDLSKPQIIQWQW